MTTTNINGGTEIRVPSGFEVESATFHVPMVDEPVGNTSSRSGFRGRLDDIKSRGLNKVHEVQNRLADRGTTLNRSVKSSISNAKVSVRDGVSRQVTRTQTSMKNSPMLWAGIAAGSGFALGMIGRIVHWRNYHRRMTPDLVIIDARC